jgi:hypothetical protein
MSRRKEPAIPVELLDQLLAGTDAVAALSPTRLLEAAKDLPVKWADQDSYSKDSHPPAQNWPSETRG